MRIHFWKKLLEMVGFGSVSCSQRVLKVVERNSKNFTEKFKNFPQQIQKNHREIHITGFGSVSCRQRVVGVAECSGVDTSGGWQEVSTDRYLIAF